MANFGSRILQVNDSGDDVKELQIRLSGFKNAGVPDGVYTTKTKLSVMTFQRDYMKIPPSGIVDRQTFDATQSFGSQFPIFSRYPNLRCPCNDPACQVTNGGYGHNDNLGYRNGKPAIEAYNRKEYLGVHRMLLWACRAIIFYNPQYTWSINSGFRCRSDNLLRGRQSTNHMGKAVDLDCGNEPESNASRRKIVERCLAQIGWNSSNKKALEPGYIAPTWVHIDVRTLDSDYLEPEFFVTNDTSLNNFVTHTVTENVDEEADETLIDSQEDVIKEQDAQGYETSVTGTSNIQTVNTNKDRGWESIAKGIYNYITTEENYDIKAVSNGVVITPAGVSSPVTDVQTNISIYMNNESSLLNFLKNTTYNGIDTGGIQRFFTGLNTWLNTPPFTIGLSIGTVLRAALVNGILTPTDIPPTGLHGLVTFPTVIAQGIACANEVSRTSFPENTREQRVQMWDIMNKYIKLALNQNIIAPIPTAGVGTNTFTGVTTVTYVYS